MPEELLSQDELIARWKVSKTTIRRLRQSGKLPAVQITSQLFRFRKSDVLALEKNGTLLPALVLRPKKPKA